MTQTDCRMRLALIITGLFTGGAEAALLKLLQHIDRDRFSPVVISLATIGEIGPRIEALGIPVRALAIHPAFPNPFKFIKLIFILWRLKASVVHTWMYHADLLGGLAARFVGIRSVAWSIHHSDLSPDMNKASTLVVVRLCARLSHTLPRAILSCSEVAAMVHRAAGYCPEKMTVIANGFDLARFVPDGDARNSVRAELGLEPDVLLVGLIARDHPLKNHSGFMEAAGVVAIALPNVHFLLAGYGIDADNLRLLALISASGVQDRFHLLGRRDDIPRLMASLDVLASSSLGEAFPNVLGEAMACGVPCVVTDVGDSARIVGDTGRVVAAGDMAGLARNIVELLQQPGLRVTMGASARQRVHEHYEIGAIARHYERFYLELVGGG